MQHPLVRAALRPMALAVLATAIIAGLTIFLPLLPIGLVVYMAMVWLTASDPAALVAKPEPARVRRADITSPQLRSQIEQINGARQDIMRSTNVTAGPLQTLLQPIADQANELYNQAVGLAEKGEIIEHYLQTSQPGRLQADIAALDQRIMQTSDTYTKDQLEETRAALIDRQQNAQALSTYYDRISAQLHNIAANLANVLAETVRLRAAEAAAASSTSNEVTERLRDLNADMDAFQHVLEGALSQSGAT